MKQKKLYEMPVCRVIPLPEEYLLLTKSRRMAHFAGYFFVLDVQ